MFKTLRNGVLAFLIAFSSSAVGAAGDQPDSPKSVESQTPQTEIEKTSVETTLPEAPPPPRSTASLIYSPIDLIIPSKIGISYGYRPGNGTVFEIEYLRGTLAIPFLVDDLGSFTDERLSLLVRKFNDEHSSFNFFYGASLVRTKLSLGSSLLSRVPGPIPSGYDLISILTAAPVIGIGNRWKNTNGGHSLSTGFPGHSP